MKYKNYITKVTCFNCRQQMKIKIPTGISVFKHPCPKCGVPNMLVPEYVGWDNGGYSLER